jgi:hypothetical protein
VNSTVNELIFEAAAIKALGASVLDATDMGTHAVEYGLRSWAVFPGNGKVPAVAGGRGVLDATTDIPTLILWWAGRYAGRNILGRVPDSIFVLDIDPRNGGLEALIELQNKYGQLPETLTTVSGRGDGGVHLFFRRPPGKLSSRRLGSGIDVKTSSGYVVLPPSIHPVTGQPYVRIARPVAAPPHWLCTLLQPEPKPAAAAHRQYGSPPLVGARTISQYNTDTSWTSILEPHGWRCLDGDPDADGARWRHPNATAVHSANIRGGRLYVWSPNTPFEISEAGNPHGHSKFDATAVLNHDGDVTAALRSLRKANTPS